MSLSASLPCRTIADACWLDYTLRAWVCRHERPTILHVAHATVPDHYLHRRWCAHICRSCRIGEGNCSHTLRTMESQIVSLQTWSPRQRKYYEQNDDDSPILSFHSYRKREHHYLHSIVKNAPKVFEIRFIWFRQANKSSRTTNLPTNRLKIRRYCDNNLPKGHFLRS